MRLAEIQNRILTKGIHAEDIKHANRLTEEQISSISVEKVYAWVRTGEWKQRDFIKWLTVRGLV